jgi:drug/metabolite transporter (DMT)-like permease
MPAAGLLLCLASAACFGAMGIFGKLAFEHGATVGMVLASRFAVASLMLWALLGASGRLSRLRALSRHDLALGVGLGALGYSAQAGAYFGALQRLSPGLLALLLYTYPTIVTIAAIRLGRERASRRSAAALGLTSAGLLLVLAGAGVGALEPVGTLLALTAAVVYSTYILTAEGIAKRVDAIVLSTLVCTGATVTLTIGSVVTGDFELGSVTAAGFGSLLAIAVVSTFAGIVLFFAGLDRVGPSTAAILSTFEPLVTVVLAGLAFGDTLTAVQLFGGVLILSGVIVLNLRRRSSPATAAPITGMSSSPSSISEPAAARAPS